MPETLKVQKIGDALGVMLPEEIDVEEGDEVFVVQTSEGLQLVISDLESAEVMEDAREFMRTHKSAFQKLAE